MIRRSCRYTGTIILAVLNAAVYTAMVAGADVSPLYLQGSSPSVTAFITYMFTHTGLMHFAVNLAVIIFAGSLLERISSWTRLMVVYLCGGISGGLLFCVACKLTGVDGQTLTGASAAALALCVAAMTWRGNIKRRFKSCPTAITGLVLGMIIVLWGLVAGNPGGSLAHLGGIAAGLLLSLLRVRRGEATDVRPVLDKALMSGYSSLSDNERRVLVGNSIRKK